MKKILKIFFIITLLCCGRVFAIEENTEIQTNEVLSEVTINSEELCLNTEDIPDVELNLEKNDADYVLDSIMETRKIDIWKEEIHNAFFGEVEAISDKPLLDKYFNRKFEKGPLSSFEMSQLYIGSFQNIWEGSEYQNSLFTNNTISTTIFGKFRNPKFGFCTMYWWNNDVPEHNYFNDVWLDQYITYNYTDNDYILLGYDRYVSGIEGTISPHLIPFFYRSQLAEHLGDARYLGIKAGGNHKYYNYNIGFGSSGRSFLDWFPGEEFNAHIAIKPLAKFDDKYGKWLLGASYDGGNPEGGSVYNLGNLYSDYEYKRFRLTLEYGLANGSNGLTGYSPNKSEGFNATVAYRVTPKIQTLFRYDWFDVNKEMANDARTEYTVGINYFIIGQALRLIINYTTYNTQNGFYGSRIYAGTQVIL